MKDLTLKSMGGKNQYSLAQNLVTRIINIVIQIHYNSTFRLTDFHCSEPLSLYWVSYQSVIHPIFTLSAAEGGVSQLTITSQYNPVGPKLNNVQFSTSGGSGNTTNTKYDVLSYIRSYDNIRVCLVYIRLASLYKKTLNIICCNGSVAASQLPVSILILD